MLRLRHIIILLLFYLNGISMCLSKHLRHYLSNLNINLRLLNKRLRFKFIYILLHILTLNITTDRLITITQQDRRAYKDKKYTKMHTLYANFLKFLRRPVPAGGEPIPHSHPQQPWSAVLKELCGSLTPLPELLFLPMYICLVIYLKHAACDREK
jgi:hypothetical protein